MTPRFQKAWPLLLLAGSLAQAQTPGGKGDVPVTLDAQGDLTLRAGGRLRASGMGVQVDGGAGTVDVKGTVINLN